MKQFSRSFEVIGRCHSLRTVYWSLFAIVSILYQVHEPTGSRIFNIVSTQHDLTSLAVSLAYHLVAAISVISVS